MGRRAAAITVAAVALGALASIRWSADAAARPSLPSRLEARPASAAPSPAAPGGGAAPPFGSTHAALSPAAIGARDRPVAAASDTVELVVPAATPSSEPVAYPGELRAGDRLLIEAEGGVVVEPAADDDIREPAVRGDIPRGALVAVFTGSLFLIGRERLLWTAPSAGRLGFAVQGSESGRTRGGYTVSVIRIGPRGDPRQRRFPAPLARFVPRREGGPLLELSLVDRSGLGLDRGTLRVLLDTRDGGRVVLTPWFEVNGGPDAADSLGARLRALPADAGVPPGLHRVTATVADALGNESAPTTVYLDRP